MFGQDDDEEQDFEIESTIKFLTIEKSIRSLGKEFNMLEEAVESASNSRNIQKLALDQIADSIALVEGQLSEITKK